MYWYVCVSLFANAVELVKQESFRPDMLVITGVLLVITIVNVSCIVSVPFIGLDMT